MSDTQADLIKSLLSVVYPDIREAAEKDLQTILTMERAKSNERIAELEQRAREAWAANHMEQESVAYWKAKAEQRGPLRGESPGEAFLRLSDLIEEINADRYGRPLIAALHLCNDLATALYEQSATLRGASDA